MEVEERKLRREHKRRAGEHRDESTEGNAPLLIGTPSLREVEPFRTTLGYRGGRSTGHLKKGKKANNKWGLGAAKEKCVLAER